MSQINELVEWDYCGSHFSLYVKHFVDDEGRKGINMIFEDVTHEKVTEMVIPTHKYPAFLRVVNAGAPRYGRSII